MVKPADSNYPPLNTSQRLHQSLIEALTANERTTFRQGIGWLVAVPTLTRSTAEQLVEPLLAATHSNDPTRRRDGYRGLRALLSHHPSIVRPHSRTIATGIEDRHLRSRTACSETLVRLVSMYPSQASVLYGYLAHTHPSIREEACSVLVQAGEQVPEIVAPVGRFFLNQVGNSTFERTALLSVLSHLIQGDSAVPPSVLPMLCEWASGTDPAVEAGAIRIILRLESTDASSSRQVTAALIDHLRRPEVVERDRVVARLLEELEHSKSAREVFHSTIATLPASDRYRLRARLDEVFKMQPPGVISEPFDAYPSYH